MINNQKQVACSILLLTRAMEAAAARICIYTKDIMGLVGCGERSARKIMSQLRKQYRKEQHQPVSLSEFCAYMGLSENEVQKRLH